MMTLQQVNAWIKKQTDATKIVGLVVTAAAVPSYNFAVQNFPGQLPYYTQQTLGAIYIRNNVMTFLQGKTMQSATPFAFATALLQSVGTNHINLELAEQYITLNS